MVDSWDEADLAKMKIAEDQASRELDYEHQAVVLENMALFYTRRGKHEDAALALKTLLNVQEKVYQTSVCKERAATLFKLGLSYGHSGQPLLAVAAFERLVELETRLGVVFPQAYQPLAAIYIEMGQYAKAQELYETALAEGAGELGYAARKYLDGLAVCLLEQGVELDRARDLFEQARDMAAELPAELGGPVEYAMALIHLARFHSKTEDMATAATLLDDAVKTLKGATGRSHPDLPGTLSDLARIKLALGDYDGAEAALVECKETLELGGLANVDDIARTQMSIDNVRREKANAVRAPLI